MLRDFNSQDWFTITFVLVGIGLMFLKQTNTAKFHRYFKLIYSKNYFQEKLKEFHYISRFENAIFILANIILTQFIYLIITESGYKNLMFSSTALNFLMIFLSLSLFFLTKYYFEKFVNYCFSRHQLLDIYLFYKHIIWSYAIFILLPALFFYVYLPVDFRYIFYLIILFSVIYYVINILIFLYRNRSLVYRYWYYFILYICALEIAPYYFLYNWLSVT